MARWLRKAEARKCTMCDEPLRRCWNGKKAAEYVCGCKGRTWRYNQTLDVWESRDWTEEEEAAARAVQEEMSNLIAQREAYKSAADEALERAERAEAALSKAQDNGMVLERVKRVREWAMELAENGPLNNPYTPGTPRWEMYRRGAVAAANGVVRTLGDILRASGVDQTEGDPGREVHVLPGPGPRKPEEHLIPGGMLVQNPQYEKQRQSLT